MPLGRRYWTLWGSLSLANLADGMFQVAVALVAVTLTRSPALVAAVSMAARLPWLLVALPAGGLADRVDRRQLMVRANAARVAILTMLALSDATGRLTVPVLVGLAFALGVAEVLFDTSSQTMLPALVAKAELSRANGRLSAAELVANQFIGPPLGGALVAVSAALALGTSAGLYGMAAVALALLPGTYRSSRHGPQPRLRIDVAEGLRYLRDHRLLRALALLLGALNLLFSAHGAVLVLYATSDTYGLGLNSTGVGLLFAVSAVGGVMGSLLAGAIEQRFRRSTVLTVSVVLSGAALAVPGLTRSVGMVAAASLLFGSIGLWNVVTVSLRQRIIPDDLLGRVNSAYRLVGWGSMPLGAALGGAVASVADVRSVFLLAGALTFALVVPLRLLVTDAAMEQAEAVAEQARPAASTTIGGAL